MNLFISKLKSKNKKAFSLLELSIVIVIVGVLLIGVIGSKHLIKKARINAAQAITRSSPISAVKGNKLWIESSLDDFSFGNGLTTGDFITAWEDNSSNNGLSISVAGTGPTYSNSINGVQAVRFDSTSANNHLVIDNPAFLNGTNYTIFFVEKRMATNGTTGNYLLGSSGSFALGYETTGSVIQTHGEASSDDNTAAIESVTSYSNKPRMISFTHSSTYGNKIYINGTLANEDSSDEAKAHLSGFSVTNTLKIGDNYNGEIGEFAIFDRGIKNSERKVIEDYLSDKWNIPNNRDSIASCTDGTLLSTGCFTVTCTANGTGYEDRSGLPYTTGGTFSCDSGYSGTISYECEETGPATIVSGSCVEATCTASGTGYDKSGLEYAESGSGSFECDDGYSGTINYSCTESGAATDITGSCIVPMMYCTGGDVVDTTSVSGYTMHVFTTTGDSTLDCSNSVAGFVDILVVAGGGGGGGIIAGGGGAGGLLYSENYSVSPNSYTITVGAGGIGGNGYNSSTQGGNVGGSSIFDVSGLSSTITAIGGGGGSHYGANTSSSDRDGGSGGGGGNALAGLGTLGQGHNGGYKEESAGERQGGGGGAGSAGDDGTVAGSGNGGDGVDYSSAFSSNYGDSGWFASGGGGGIRSGNGTVGTASAGGGGDGTNSSTKAGDGQANTGGGGGGAGYTSGNTNILGGNGGSGIVIVRYSSCPSGKVAVGGLCVDGCEVSNIVGTSAANSAVADGTTITCDETGYDGTTLGTCSGGSTITGSCGCASGYDLDGGVCKQQCTLSAAESGLGTDVILVSGTTQYNCADYVSGDKAGILSLTSACDDGSSVTVASGSCVSNSPPSCVGGDITDTTSVPGYTMHIFTTIGDATLDCTGGSNGIAQILVVAGAGGGGGTMGGGGGAGGLLFDPAYSVSASTYNLTIGEGGSGGTGYNTANQGGSTGDDSIFDTLAVSSTMTSYGGGGGCHYAGAATETENDGIGGSGGGPGSGHVCAGTGITGQGNNGGTHNSSDGSGGGGGAGSVGGTSDEDGAGDGGAGINYSDEFSTTYGDSGWFASGGGGGIRDSKGKPAGTSPYGGGGDGTTTSVKAGDGQANTGGGGGGAGYHSGTSSILGGNGGSGIIIIKYLTDAP